MQSRYTIEEQEWAVKRYYRKVSVVRLCEEYGVSKSTIYSWIKNCKRHYRDYRKISFTSAEVYKLERLVASLTLENDIFKKSGCGTASSNAEKIEAVNRLKSEFAVSSICRTLKLSKATYYRYEQNKEKQRWFDLRNEALRSRIKEIFDESKERFGSAKIVVKLKQKSIQISRAHVDKLMKEMGLICKQRRLRMFNTTNRYCRYRKNRLKQNFDKPTPNMFWASDVTYILVGNEDYYVCVVIELFSRKILAIGISNKHDTNFVLSVLKKAYEARGKPQNLIFHSDQGVQYTSYAFRKYLRENKIKQSLSTPRTPYDNAVVESFSSIMKREILSHKWYKTPQDLEVDVKEFVSYYNGFRPLKRLKNLTPDEFENNYFNGLKNKDWKIPVFKVPFLLTST